MAPDSFADVETVRFHETRAATLSAGAGPRSGLRPSSRAPAEDQELVELRRAVRAALRVGLWAWIGFAPVEQIVVWLAAPSADPLRLFALRLLGLLPAFAAHLIASRRALSARELQAAEVVSFGWTALITSVMALDLGGLESFYLHGISLAVMLRAALVPSRFRRSLAVSALMVAAYPLVMVAAAPLVPDVARALRSGAALGRFLGDYTFVLATMILGAVASHTLFVSRRQVYVTRRLGRYRLKARIGAGGMGEVWLAWDEALRRDVALKVMQKNATGDRDAISLFEREARAASQLSSPHTIRIFDFGASDDGIAYIAMELLDGADLDTLVREHGPLPDARVARIAEQVCLSLAEAEERGIVHRDIKPANLFLTRAGEDEDFVRLLDFGIAKVADPNLSCPRTMTGKLVGTPAYLAPEIWAGRRADARSDLYGLGLTLYVMLTGQHPFLREGGTLTQVGARPEPPSSCRKEPVHPALEAVVLRCLEPNPARRFQSASELRAALVEAGISAGWTRQDARAFWQARRASLGAAEPRQPVAAPERRVG